MKDDDNNFNFEDDFESSAEESPKTLTDEVDLLDGELEPQLDEEAEEATPKKFSGLMDFIKANIIFIVIGIVVIGVAGYMSYGILFPSTPASVPAQAQQPKGFGLKPVVPEPTKPDNATQATPSPLAATKAPASSANVMPPVNTVSPPVAQPVEPSTITMTQQDMRTLMEGFAKIVNQNSENIYNQLQNLGVLVQEVGQASLAEQKQTDQVTAALSNMQHSMDTLNAEIAIYNKNMMIVGKQLDKTQQQLSLLLAEQSAQVQKLTLRAVVPGRAWLVDDQGNTTTVTVGTQLSNYGTVVNIDSGKGEVVMSTGYVFK